QAWSYLVHDYSQDTHLLSIFAFGRGNCSYITREREWQQSTGFFGKLANSHMPIMRALQKEGITSFPAVPTLRRVARFEFFRNGSERSAGVWLVRQGMLRFALPITTGPKPGASDYLPAPYGLPGFAAPVEQSYPVLTPFLELADGRVAVATDGADQIMPSSNELSLRARWNRWAILGTKSGTPVDIGLTSEVVWRIENGSLIREETLNSNHPIRIRNWRLAVPSAYAKVETETINGLRVDRFYSPDGALEVSLSNATFPVSEAVLATGNGVLGKGGP